MILIIDNYDSFTYNIYQLTGGMYPNVLVRAADDITIDEIEKLTPKGIIISSGAGLPADYPNTLSIISAFIGKIPILGVGLGYLAIAETKALKITPSKTVMHGKSAELTLDINTPLFFEMPVRIKAAMYHSFIVLGLDNPAATDGSEAFALSDPENKLYGVGFAPESVMTEHGVIIFRNFLRICGIPCNIPLNMQHQDPEALKPYIGRLIMGKPLSADEAKKAMDMIMGGLATNAQIGSFLTALRMKGETTDEITGFARSMRARAAVMPSVADTIDIVGTGGDLAHTFNISTAAAFVAAAAGATVAKHGNRSVSSLCGSADVLEQLGVNIGQSAEKAALCLKETGMCFMFAPTFHQSMRFAASPRREIGVRSVFNILGPLANPAGAEYMLLGCYDIALMEPMAEVLQNLGIKKALIVHGADGLDEITLSDRTEICEVEQNKLSKYSIHPSEFGLSVCDISALKGGTPKENAQILTAVLQGEQSPKRDIVLLNTAAALYALGKCFNIAHGVNIAAETIDTGKAYEKLMQVIKVTGGSV